MLVVDSCIEGGKRKNKIKYGGTVVLVYLSQKQNPKINTAAHASKTLRRSLFFSGQKKKVDLEIIKCTFHSDILNDKKRSLQIC